MVQPPGEPKTKVKVQVYCFDKPITEEAEFTYLSRGVACISHTDLHIYFLVTVEHGAIVDNEEPSVDFLDELIREDSVEFSYDNIFDKKSPEEALIQDIIVGTLAICFISNCKIL